MKLSEDHRKMLKIATMYYEQELTQATISKELGISRPVISKILQKAKEQGIVSISIRDESAYTIHLGLQLEKKFKLKDVLVVAATQNKQVQVTKHEVSCVAANYLVDQLTPTMSIGLSWGTTLADMIDEMPYQSFPNIRVCPLVGGISSEHLYYDTNHLAFRLSEKLSSHCQYFYAPALAETLSFAHALNHSNLVKSAINGAKEVDFAIIGIGNPKKNSTWKNLGYLKETELQQESTDAIVGDAVASLFDKHGQTVLNSLTQRMIGIKVEDLQQIATVMLIAYGQEKTESIQALLNGKLVNVLVIDQSIAEALLAVPK